MSSLILPSLGTPRTLARGTLSASLDTYHTADPKRPTFVVSVTMCNTSGAAATGTVKLAGVTLLQASIAPGETLDWTGLQRLDESGTLEAQGSAPASLTIHILGID